MHNPNPFGFVLRTSDDSPVFLPLKSVSVHATVIDISAQVELTQIYANADALQNTAARYLFPVPANAAVCAFRMETTDGRVVRAVVKEKAAAKAEYESAVKKGKWAGLLEQVTGDVFAVSVGAIPRGQDIKVKITYVEELPQDDLVNQVRFTLPTYIAERYGSAPEALSAPSSSNLSALQINVNVQMASAIQKISSPSHNIESTVPVLVQLGANQPAVYKSSVKLAPSSQYATLTKDFILTIQAASLHKPRCLASVLPSKNSVAMSLTLVPQFGIPPIPEQEYIFVIDRSGSMHGSSIAFAKDALTILLKSLPGKGTCFNIASFGSSYEMMWDISRPYGKESLREAVTYVQGMDADMGGTEINAVLSRVYGSRVQNIPTSVFVLTDGEVWNTAQIFDTTRAAVAKAGPASKDSNRYLRVFTLGIGYGASTALCEGLARMGNGLCYMVADSADIPSRCSHLLKAAKVPPVASLWEMKVDWGRKGGGGDVPMEVEGSGKEKVGGEPPKAVDAKTFSFFDESLGTPEDIAKQDAEATATALLDPDIESLRSQLIRQAPATVPDIYPFNRFIVSAILLKTTQVPDNVTLSGKLPGTGEDVKMTFPVQQVDEETALLHTLAARRLITDLQDGKYLGWAEQTAAGVRVRNEAVKAEVVRLSEEYQLASEYAAFVAVEETKDMRGEDVEKQPELASEEDEDWLQVELVQPVKEVPEGGSPPASLPSYGMMSVGGGGNGLGSAGMPLAMPPLQAAPTGFAFGAVGALSSMIQPQFTGFSYSGTPARSPPRVARMMMSAQPLPQLMEARRKSSRAPPPPPPIPPPSGSMLPLPPPPPMAASAPPPPRASPAGAPKGITMFGGGPPVPPAPAAPAAPPSRPVFERERERERASSGVEMSKKMAPVESVSSEDDDDIGFQMDGQPEPTAAIANNLFGSAFQTHNPRSPGARRGRPAPEVRSRPAMRLEPITIALLQDHSGSFSLTDDVAELLALAHSERGDQGTTPTLAELKQRIPPALGGYDDREEVWATLLVAALMMKSMANTRDTWIGMWAKAKEYVLESVGGDEDLFASLLEEAEKIV